MIKIFRRIRYDLMEKNKTGKYLKYAIGEIVLVVIGILIALQLNNENEKRNIHLQQKGYLLSIQQEMTNNLKSLDIEYQEIITCLNSVTNLLITMDSESKTDSISERELSFLIAAIPAQDFELPYENGALTELLSSGGLKNIENDSIRNILASWEGKISKFRIQELIVAEHQKSVLQYLNRNGSVKAIVKNIPQYAERLKYNDSKNSTSNKHLLRSSEFENNVLTFYLSTSALQESIYPDFESEMNSLITLIKQELEQD